MNDSNSARRLHRARVYVLAIVISGFVIAGSFDPLVAAESSSTTTTGTLQIRVVDAAGKALPDTKIHSSIWTKQKGFKSNRDYKCDDHGQVTVELPTTLEIIRV